jgi:Domain of unknown function (DUF4340)
MIKTKTIGILGAALVGAIGVTVLVLQNREKAVQSAETRTTLFPGFAAAMKDAAKIEVKRKDAAFTLERKGAKWGLADANGYPVDAEPVRKLLFALSEMETVEAKTQTKELYSQLGVEDHDAEGAKSALVTVTDTGGKELARLVVGKNYEPKQYSPKQQSYVRKAGEAQSWLVKGQLDLKEKGTDWLEREILKVTRERIASVEVKHPDGQVVRVSKAAPELTDYSLESSSTRRSRAPSSAASSTSTSRTSSRSARPTSSRSRAPSPRSRASTASWSPCAARRRTARPTHASRPPSSSPRPRPRVRNRRLRPTASRRSPRRSRPTR